MSREFVLTEAGRKNIEMQARSAIEEKHYDVAVGLFDRLRRYNRRYNIDYGRSLYLNGDIKKVLSLYDEMLRSKQKNLQVMYLKSLILLEIAEYQQSIKTLEVGIQMILNHQENKEKNRNKSDGSAMTSEKIEKVWEYIWKYHQLIAINQYMMQDYQSVAKSLEHFIKEIDKTSESEGVYQLNLTLMIMGNVEDALLLTNKIIDSDVNEDRKKKYLHLYDKLQLGTNESMQYIANAIGIGSLDLALLQKNRMYYHKLIDKLNINPLYLTDKIRKMQILYKEESSIAASKDAYNEIQ